jgi:hypothetical protein
MRDALLVYIREIAGRFNAQEFPSALESALRDDPRVADLMNANMLTFKSVRIEKITLTEHS